jgi:DNA gyrase subunit A
VRGITMKEGTEMLGMEVSNGKGDLFVITERGFGKRTPIADYPEHKRGGQGVFTIQMTDKKGNLAAMRVVGPQHELVIISEDGAVIRVRVKDISRLGRSTQGVKVMNIAEDDRVASLARMLAEKSGKKAAKAASANQATLDLLGAGAADADAEEEPVDLGDDDVDESLLNGED